ncbi:MAG: hypothetical protein PSX81_12225 [bacterium]|nr:hypothetical protein [bacterium]
MTDKQKIMLFLFELVCNFTFLATAQSNPCSRNCNDTEQCIFHSKAPEKIVEKDSTVVILQHPEAR